jgi:hypothetical protein
MLHPYIFALPAQHVRMGKTGNKHIVQRRKIGHLVRFLRFTDRTLLMFRPCISALPT